MALAPGVRPVDPRKEVHLIGVITACVTTSDELQHFMCSMNSIMMQEPLVVGDDPKADPVAPLSSLWVSLYASPHLPQAREYMTRLMDDQMRRRCAARDGDIRVLMQRRIKPSEMQMVDVLQRMPDHYAKRPGFLESAWILRGTHFGIWSNGRTLTYLNVVGATIGEGQFSDRPVCCVKSVELLIDPPNKLPLCSSNSLNMVVPDMVESSLADLYHLMPRPEYSHLWWPQVHDICVPYRLCAEYYMSRDARRRYLMEYNTFADVAFVDWVCNYGEGSYSVLAMAPNPAFSNWLYYWVPIDWRRDRKSTARVIDAILRPNGSLRDTGVVAINTMEDAIEHAQLIGEMMEIPLWERNKAVYELRKHQLACIHDTDLCDQYTKLCGKIIAERITERTRYCKEQESKWAE